MFCIDSNSIVVYICLFALAVFSAGDCHEATSKSASVYCKHKQCKFSFDKLDWNSATAVATFNNTINSTGWGILDISAGFKQGPRGNNEDIMFAAGFVEGVLTSKHMEYQYTNVYNYFFKQPPPASFMPKLKNWFALQRKWTDTMVSAHKGSSPLWRHVSYILAQLDGLLAGYQSIQGSNKGTLDAFAVNFLQTTGDLLDLVKVIDERLAKDWRKFTPSEARRYFRTQGHCSALVKPLPDLENVFMSHSSWFAYQSTDRIYKHYNFNVKDLATASKRVSFSSYGGFLESLDDFYVLGNDMVMLQTTNNLFNTSLYSQVTTNSLFSWQRVRIAHMMANNGEEWTKIIAQYNSGTYNNQYMVIDLKKMKLNGPLQNGSLWVAEQIPGLVVAQDLTHVLREQGYFPSYNIPYFKEIYNKSGYPEAEIKMGDGYSYELAPRAKIFRRDQHLVTDMNSMKRIMRYNDYLHDPLSQGNPWNAICSRGDLDLSNPMADGCYDTKVTDFSMAKDFQADIINGPTLGTGLEPFAWAGRFQNTSHVGLPAIYNFPFIRTEPTLQNP